MLHRQGQPIRNIAEELDPTFQARRQGTESLRVGQTGTINRNSSTQNDTVKNSWTLMSSFLQYRPNLSVASHAAFWLTRLPRGAHIYPTHKTANGQIRTHKTQREEGKLQATVTFSTHRAVGVHVLYIFYNTKHQLSYRVLIASYFKVENDKN